MISWENKSNTGLTSVFTICYIASGTSGLLQATDLLLWSCDRRLGIRLRALSQACDRLCHRPPFLFNHMTITAGKLPVEVRKYNDAT